MKAREYFNTKKRQSLGLPRYRFDQLCEYSIEELVDYLDEDLETEALKEKVEKGSKIEEAFIQIPKDKLKEEIKTEDDRLLFLFDCLLFTYGRHHNILYYDKSIFFEYFNLKPMLNREAKKVYCKKYKYVELKYERGQGYAISYCDYEEENQENINIDNATIIPLQSKENKKKTNTDEISIIKKKIEEIEKYYVFDNEILKNNSDYKYYQWKLQELTKN